MKQLLSFASGRFLTLRGRTLATQAASSNPAPAQTSKGSLAKTPFFSSLLKALGAFAG